MICKKVRKYCSKELKYAIIITVILYATLVFVFLQQEENLWYKIGYYALMPITAIITGRIFTLIIKSNAIIDVKLCNHRYILSKKDVTDVWAISEIEQSELVDCTFAEIRNIGETMVTLIKVIINHNNDKGNINYVIPYALKKDESIYLAISMKNDPLHKINNITVINYAGRDTAKNFYGKRSEADDIQIFSGIRDARENNSFIDMPCYRIGLSKKQPPL